MRPRARPRNLPGLATGARHANVDLNLGKTRVWNAAGEEPPALSMARQCGSGTLTLPLGHDAFQKAALLAKRCQHDSLLDKLPSLPDLQTAWLLILVCPSPRSNYLLRTMQPSTSEEPRPCDLSVVPASPPPCTQQRVAPSGARPLSYTIQHRPAQRHLEVHCTYKLLSNCRYIPIINPITTVTRNIIWL